MAIGRDGFRLSQVAACVCRAPTYLLTEEEARSIVDRQVEKIEEEWDEVCDLGQSSEVDRRRLRGGAFLNPFSIDGY
jgi:serine/threonine-protein kinase HipA